MASGLWAQASYCDLERIFTQIGENKENRLEKMQQGERERRRRDSCPLSYVYARSHNFYYFFYSENIHALFSLRHKLPKFKTLIYFEIFELFKIKSPYNSWQGWQTETVCKSFLPTCTDHFLAATGRAGSSDHLVSLCLLLSGFTLSSPARFSLGDTTDSPALNLHFRACHWRMCLSNCDPVRRSNSALDGLLAGSALDGSGTNPRFYLEGKIQKNALTQAHAYAHMHINNHCFPLLGSVSGIKIHHFGN